MGRGLEPFESRFGTLCRGLEPSESRFGIMCRGLEPFESRFGTVAEKYFVSRFRTGVFYFPKYFYQKKYKIEDLKINQDFSNNSYKTRELEKNALQVLNIYIQSF